MRGKNKYHLLTHLVIIRVYTVTKATGHLRLTETTPPPAPPINTCQYGGIIALFTAEYYRSCPNFGGAILSCSCGILAKHFGIQQQNREHYITDQIILFFHQKLSFPTSCIWSLIMQINAKHLGKMFTRWHFEIFLLFFSGHRIWYHMQIIINGDNLHEMINQDLWKNKKITSVCHLLNILRWKKQCCYYR